MFLSENNLSLGAMQRLPQPDPSLQRATQMVGELQVPALHLAQQSDGPQARGSLQQRHNLSVPIRFERIGASPFSWLTLLRGHTGIGIEPGARAEAEIRFRRGGLAAVSASESHVQFRLLIGDVCAGHSGDLFLAVETPSFRHAVTESQAAPVGSRFDAGGNLRSGYARPPAAPGVINPDCRS